MTDKETLKLALEALETDWGTVKAIAAIKEALAKQEQGEPVCHICKGTGEMDSGGTHPWGWAINIPCECTAPQPKQEQGEPWLLESTQEVAKAMAKEFYPEVTQWKVLDDLAGVISQIDNMTTGLIRKPKQEQGEPVVFKIYKPTPPRHAIPNVRDAELPWVYDQDPSSGNVASMWVTPVQTLRSKNDR